jgi:hypothetical protein
MEGYMDTRILVLACLGVTTCLSQPAYSDEVVGVYVGTVDAGGTGTVGNFNASAVAPGTPVFGTFTYNSQIFQVGGLNGNGFYLATGSSSPAEITETIDGSTFTVSGTIQSVLNLVALPPSQDPNNSFYLEAANWGSSVAPGSFSGSIDLNLSNYLGAPFASNINNSGSVAFFNQNGLGVSEIDTLQGINAQGNSTGSIYFSITHAFAIPVPVRAPEIDPASTVSALTLLLGGIAVMRGRKCHA